jgi:RNAse (barnase) inhibitor barstar
MGLMTLDHGAGNRLHVLVAAESDTCNELWAWQKVGPGRRVARIVRGKKCTIRDDVFDEFAAAWQFPCYFGENWDALEECLTDLEWLPASAYLLLVTNATHALEKSSLEQRRIFWSLLQRVSSSWSQARQPPVPFHVLAHTTQERCEALRLGLETAGISYDLLP